jgi:hypothetical protein
MDPQHLNAIPLFAGLSKDQRREVARVAAEIDIEAVMTDSPFRSLAHKMPDVAEEIREACKRRGRELSPEAP